MDYSELTLKLDFVLDDESLALVINLLGELGRDGVVSGRVLDNKTLIALHSLVDGRLLDRPLADIGPFLLIFARAGHVLLGVRWLPSLLPVVGELLEEASLDGGGLKDRVSIGGEGRRLVRTMKG